MLAAVTAAFLAPAVLGNQTATAGSIFRGMSRTHPVTTHNHDVTEGLHPLKNASPGFSTARATRAYLKRVALQETVSLYEFKKEIAKIANQYNLRRGTTTQQEITKSPQKPGEDLEISRTQRDISQLDRELNRLLGTRWGKWFGKLRDWIYQKLWRSPFKGAVSYPSADEALQKFYDGTSNLALMSGKDTTDGQWKWFTVVKWNERYTDIFPAQGEDRGDYYPIDNKVSWSGLTYLDELNSLTSVKLTPYESLPEDLKDWKDVITSSKRFEAN